LPLDKRKAASLDQDIEGAVAFGTVVDRTTGVIMNQHRTVVEYGLSID
jgi:hypothetical protein